MELERSMKESDMKALELIQDVTRNCSAVQAKVLAEILTCNADTEYLKRHRLEGRTDCHSFKARVPVVDYEDILPDIKRIANGDSSLILSSHRITEFFTSSATSGGECKLLPATQEEFDKKLLFRSLVTPVMNMYFPGLDKGKALYFQCIMAGTKTRGGLVAQPALSSWYKSDHFKNFMLYSQHTSPIELVLCLDSFQSLYSQLLAGLYQRLDVLRVGATFALGLIQAIQFLHLHHLEICQDIAMGILSPKITDPSVRGAMSKIMKPDPNLARTIKEECSRENWVCGIIKRIWPNTKCLDATVTGTMAQYIPTLNLYSGGLPKASMVYAASEGLFGINLKPMASPSEVSYTIMPNMAYFEFIPLDDDNSSLLVDLEDVQVGKEYELVITTYAGLYRYRVGDILRVTGFHNSTPEFRFVCRKNVLLSIDVDKTNEVGLQKAIDKASVLLHKRSNASIAEYTSYADTTTTPGHYVIYWELTMPIDDDVIVSDELLGRCCLEMEESLGGLYRMCRVARGSMGPLEIRIVSSGTFDELMVDALSRGASIHQYKVPRCISFLPIVKLLDRRVVSAHFSPNLPRWSSDDLADTQVQPPT